MRFRRFLPSLLALASVAAAGNAAALQERRGDAAAGSQPPPPGEPDIVVQGRRLSELRFELRIAEEAVYARFNEINSDDRFDVTCTLEKRYASRINERRCWSNDWREQDSNIGEATLRRMRGEAAAPLEMFRAEQLRNQRLLQDEMLRLALRDEALYRAVTELGAKQLQLDEARGRQRASTRERELTSVDGRLPFGAERVFEVKVGSDPWSQALTTRTFTITLFSGEIDEIEVACDSGNEDFDFAADVEWTLPDDWNSCIVSVRADKDTTFALYQF